MSGWQPSLDIARVQAVLFDLDGTLADTDNILIDKVAQRLGPLHFAFPQRDPRPFLRWGLMKSEGTLNYLLTVPDRLGVDATLAAVGERMRRGRPRMPHPLAPVAGVPALVADVAQRYPLAVVSTRDGLTTTHFLAEYGIEDHFQVVVTALTAKRLKPHPAPVLHAAAMLGIAPAHCLMVGDTTMDVRAGKRAGAQTVGVLCGFGERDELERAGANLILDTTADLKHYLD